VCSFCKHASRSCGVDLLLRWSSCIFTVCLSFAGKTIGFKDDRLSGKGIMSKLC
jgi:hypothetical protein